MDNKAGESFINVSVGYQIILWRICEYESEWNI